MFPPTFPIFHLDAPRKCLLGQPRLVSPLTRSDLPFPSFRLSSSAFFFPFPFSRFSLLASRFSFSPFPHKRKKKTSHALTPSNAPSPQVKREPKASHRNRSACMICCIKTMPCGAGPCRCIDNMVLPVYLYGGKFSSITSTT